MHKKNISLKKMLLFGLGSIIATSPIAIAISCGNPKPIETKNSEILLNYDFKTNPIDLERYEKYNQIHILSEINEYFKNTNHDDLFIFKEGAEAKNVTFDNMMKNNFMVKYMEFDKDKFKSIIRNEFKLSDEFLNRLDFHIDYNNVYYDPGNYFDVLIPVNVKLYLKNHNKAEYIKGMFVSQPIKFRLPNIKDKNQEKNKDIFETYNEIKKIKDTDFQIKLNDSINQKEIQDLINKWGITQLDSMQLSKIFEVKNEAFDKLKKDKEAKNLQLKMTAFDFDLSDKNLASNEGFLKIRVGVINDDKKKNDKSLKTPEAGVTFRVKFKFDNEFLKNLRVSESIKVNTIFQNEINSDHEIFDASNLIVKSLNKDIKKIEVVELKSNGFRSSKVKLNVYLKDKKDPVVIEKIIGSKKDALLYESEFTKKNIIAPNFATDRITTTNLASIKKDFFATYNSYIFSGGYGISRGFYGNDTIKTPSYLHFGEDYLAPDHQAILMPYDGEIIAAYDLPVKAAWTGVGTVVVIKIPVQNLTDWSPKEKELYLNDNKQHIYMSFLHLDAQKTLNNPIIGISSKKAIIGTNRDVTVADGITPKKPKVVKKGQIIGYLGTEATNGGWMSHAHVNLYSNRKNYLSPNYFSTPQRPDLDDSRIDKYYDEKKMTYTQIGNIGVSGIGPSNAIVNKINPKTGEEIKVKDSTGKMVPEKIADEIGLYKSKLSITEYEIKKGYLNPNVVYDLRDDKTVSFGIEEFFDLNKQK
ncbi:Hypothetical protein, predicted lipoprotein [Metamycoplasma auris 15026]|uniref:Lipoprotein n=1 Tax=Metamycoplasma auris 15026 TaxID=1188233 RepID=N9UZZ3_9BACT|nr:hypothetical protein [Metamycoplasma auris]ENY68722.1 Hypothetical protein, predicted lipoprotein [Metamycoplasma auris 15026]